MSVLREAAMADDASRSRLGRGLASLIGDVGAENTATDRSGRGQRRVPIEHLRANPRNPRKHFSEAELADLANSIAERGIIQPIIVRAVRNTDMFEIIAGERRWRAAQRAALHDVPVVVVEATDSEALQLAIIENVQRADLDPLEEAAGYQSLIDQFSYAQDDIAKTVGKSRSHVANTLRLLKLPDAVKALLHAGTLSAGHARMLVGQPNADELARTIVEQGLNVRQVEALMRGPGERSAAKVPRAAKAKDPNTVAVERQVSDALGLAVSIDHRGDSGGTIQIKYSDLDQLDDIVRRLSRAG
jgi:ParB family transcriptional regulator, chromosome partitioning protein